jgi:nucleotide-binding universal stress UspA family protein|uniref:Universal stress protein n=1 Tax=Desulfobacca acetoxidans TaxID=60893 RepID=A0A7C3SHI5_9BACT
MPPKVLVAVDFDTPTPWAWQYAVQLSARLRLPLSFLGVLVSAEGADREPGDGLYPEELAEGPKQQLQDVLQQCQKEGVGLEIFLTEGSFFQEVKRLVNSAGNFKFLVMGAPRTASLSEMEAFSEAIRELHGHFSGGILLVQEQGSVTRLDDRGPKKKGGKP